MMRVIFFLAMLGTLFFHSPGNAEVGMKIKSSEFEHQTNIPEKFTCLGEDVSPALELIDVPPGAKSLALIVDDPDAPACVWVHWVVFNIDPATRLIPENSVPGTLGWNDAGQVQWQGPCPPRGTHRYFFKAYALDTVLSLKEGARKAELEKAMKGHIIGQAELVGLFQK